MMFHMPTQPSPYAAIVHSSMYRKGAMGTSVSRLNTVAAKPFLQAHKQHGVSRQYKLVKLQHCGKVWT
jgi:hypothetical protein